MVASAGNVWSPESMKNLVYVLALLFAPLAQAQVSSPEILLTDKYITVPNVDNSVSFRFRYPASKKKQCVFLVPVNHENYILNNSAFDSVLFLKLTTQKEVTPNESNLDVSCGVTDYNTSLCFLKKIANQEHDRTFTLTVKDPNMTLDGLERALVQRIPYLSFSLKVKVDRCGEPY